MTLVKGHSGWIFWKSFFSETTRPIEIIFHMKPSRASRQRGEESLYIWSRSHDQDGLHAQKCSKTLKNLLLQNHWADYLETWYVASGTVVLQSLYKWWSWVDDLFYGKVKLSPLGFRMWKAKTMHFSATIVVCDMEKLSIVVPMNV